MRGGMRRVAASLGAMLLTLGAGACGGATTSARVPGGPSITVAVPADEPGLGYFHEGAYAGFDVDVAKYVAHKLGYAGKQIVFTTVRLDSRITALEQGKVDMLVSSLPMASARSHQAGDDQSDSAAAKDGNPEAADDFKFAGPILTTHQDFLVPQAKGIGKAEVDRVGKGDVCTVSDSGSGDAVSAAFSGAHVQVRGTYAQCLTALMAGEADAVSADDAVLQGTISSERSGQLSMLKHPVAQLAHGVWTRGGNRQLSSQIDGILHSMVKDGSWKHAVDALERTTGYHVDTQANPPTLK